MAREESLVRKDHRWSGWESSAPYSVSEWFSPALCMLLAEALICARILLVLLPLFLGQLQCFTRHCLSFIPTSSLAFCWYVSVVLLVVFAEKWPNTSWQPELGPGKSVKGFMAICSVKPLTLLFQSLMTSSQDCHICHSLLGPLARSGQWIWAAGSPGKVCACSALLSFC